MKQKHTPAPWRATKNGSIEHEEGILGEAYDFDSGYLGLKAEGLPMMANARLMAAAPEMLEMIKEMTELLYEIGERLDNELVSESLMRIVKRSRAYVAQFE